MRRFDVLIVGAGHAGAQTAIALRKLGFAGSIGLVGDEPEEPYERPPLSKGFLRSGHAADGGRLRPSAFWSEQRIELLLGQRVVEVAPSDRLVVLAGEDRIGFKNLVWATGGDPRRLPCVPADTPCIHYLRNRADAAALAEALAGSADVVIVGGGYVGLEVAAAIGTNGRRVVVLEAADRLLARVAGPEVSAFYEQEHRARGVDVRTGAQVVGADVVGGSLASLRLADGTTVPADLVIVGIGVEAAVAPLLAAGAAAACGGLLVDAACRTTLAGIYAVGDCAAFGSVHAGGEVVRLESVQNANDQAAVAAATICGMERVHDALPWFWSDQYDLKLQSVGLARGFDATVLRGNLVARSFSVAYLREGRIVALDCVNAMRDYVQGRALIASGAIVDPVRLADVSVPLKSLVARGGSDGPSTIAGCPIR